MRSQLDPRLVAALEEQLEQRRAALARGAQHVGWKLGMGDRESIGGEIAVGYLTSATVLEPGARYWSEAGARLHADAEAVVELGRDVDPAAGAGTVAAAIAGYGAALELVDLAPVPGEPDAVVVANVFHRAVAFAELAPGAPTAPEVALAVDGEVRASGRWPDDLHERLWKAAVLLRAVGEQFRAGDGIITGSIVQVPVRAGERVAAEFVGVASVELQIEPHAAGVAGPGPNSAR